MTNYLETIWEHKKREKKLIVIGSAHNVKPKLF
jgi:hypothetical protein